MTVFFLVVWGGGKRFIGDVTHYFIFQDGILDKGCAVVVFKLGEVIEAVFKRILICRLLIFRIGKL